MFNKGVKDIRIKPVMFTSQTQGNLRAFEEEHVPLCSESSVRLRPLNIDLRRQSLLSETVEPQDEGIKRLCTKTIGP